MKGRNLTESEHIKLGAYHTIELEQGRAFTLAKDNWDSLDVERIKQACDPKLSADLAAVLITVRGYEFISFLHSKSDLMTYCVNDSTK